MSKYNLILIPAGATLPEDLKLKIVPRGDFIAAIAAAEAEPAVMEVGSRELQALVEYRDLFNCDLVAVVGLSGTIYNTIWNQYVSTMRRTTVDQLLADQQVANDVSANTGQQTETNVFLRRQAVSISSGLPGTVDDDDTTGDIGG